MTIKEKLEQKLIELEEVKSNILTLSSFLNPDNNFFIYSSLSLSKISGYTGSTPNNLAEVLTTVTSAINTYVDTLQTVPYAETTVIRADRGVQTYGIVSEQANAPTPVTWLKNAESISFSAMMQYLPMSTYVGYINRLTITISPSFTKGGVDGESINFKVMLYRINARLGILEEYMTSGGYMSSLFGTDTLNGDDIFIMAFRPSSTIISGVIYASDLSYTVKIEGKDDKITTVSYAIGDTNVGNIIPDVDFTLQDGALYWDMLSINDMDVEVEMVDETTRKILPEQEVGNASSHIDGNIASLMHVYGTSLDLTGLRLSAKSTISKGIGLINDTYSFYDKRESGVSSLVFKNMMPIDIVLERAINAL